VSDPAHYRKALGHVPTSVSIITATGRGGPIGMTIGSFTSVSLTPPLIAFFIDKGSSTWPLMYESDRFGVNVLGHRHSELCRTFSRPVADRFEGVDWQPSPHGIPLLDEAIVALECTRVKVDVIGDHYQVVGRVESLEVRAADPPLVFVQGGFLDLTPPTVP